MRSLDSGMLADRITSRPQAGMEWIIPELRATTTQRYVLDAGAVEMMVRLTQQLPDKVAPLVQAGWPAADVTWVEYSARQLFEARDRWGAQPPEGAGEWKKLALSRPAQARVGALIKKEADGSLSVNVMEDDAESPGRSFCWPCGFRLYAVSQRHHEDDLPEQTKKDFERLIWGYTRGIDLGPLKDRARVTLHHTALKHPNGGQLIAATLSELAGVLRLTMSAMSLLNTVAEVGPSLRPEGHRIGAGGHTRPYLPRALVRLEVPRRVRDPVRWATQAAKEHAGRRLHEVRAHWRYLRREPARGSWERIEMEDGRVLWRRPIAQHLRGNPDIGVVEHAGVGVVGSRRLRVG